MKTLVFFIVVAIAATIVQSAPPHRPPPPPPPSASDSHHIQLVLTWSPVFCRINSCNLQIVRSNFYLHGLWPAKADGSTLTDCEGVKFTGVVLRELFWYRNNMIRNLERWWSSIKNNVPHQEFWRHEWNTHGVCNPRLNVIAYFNQGVLKVHGTDLLQVLKDGGIVPSDYILYTRKQIMDAIEARIGAGNRVYLSCINENPCDRHTPCVKLLKEVYICLDLTATSYISCPYSHDFKGCGRPLPVTPCCPPLPVTPTIKLAPLLPTPPQSPPPPPPRQPRDELK